MLERSAYAEVRGQVNPRNAQAVGGGGAGDGGKQYDYHPGNRTHRRGR